jgi:hypothetical protein
VCSVEFSGNILPVALHAAFEARNRPTKPSTVAATPPTNIHIDLSVAEPLKNREMSELVESYALIPKIRRRIPPARTASEIALFIDRASRLVMIRFPNGRAVCIELNEVYGTELQNESVERMKE